MEIYSESRPWGRFEKFHENKPCTTKLIYVNAHSLLSLQYHKKRAEFWKVIKGTAVVELDGHPHRGGDCLDPKAGAAPRGRARQRMRDT